MGKYLKRFSSVTEYNAAASTLDRPNVSYIDETGAVTYNPVQPAPPSFEAQYLTFEIPVGTGTIQWEQEGKTESGSVSYSTDGGSTWSMPAESFTLNVSSGDTILFKAEGDGDNGMGTFSGSTALFIAYGNIMSMAYGDNFSGQTSLAGKSGAVFQNLFYGTQIVHAENLILPATTLCSGCYQGMFQGCSALLTAPALPATTLADECYSQMFKGCTSLGATPVLSAQTLVSWCYANMFEDCTTLQSITCLATDISAVACTSNWVSGLEAGGTFYKASGMNDWEEGSDSGIPNKWEVQDYAG